MGLTDTDILIDFSRGLPEAAAFLNHQLSGDGLHASIVTAMELVRGARDAAQLSHVRGFLAQFQIHPITPTMSETALDHIIAFSLSHGLTMPDALIAATSIEKGWTLYTRNVRHFQMIPGLAVQAPY